MRKLTFITIFLLFTLVSNSHITLNNKFIEKELTIENIIVKMKKLELDHIPILVAQIRLETGNLKKITHKNNLMGFKKTTNGKYGYRIFETWEDCLVYLKEWQLKRVYNKNSQKSYYNMLIEIGYAVDTLYISKLIKFNQNKYSYEQKNMFQRTF